MFERIGTPLTSEKLDKMTKERQLLYKSFFDEAKRLLKDQDSQEKWPAPTESLQVNYEGIIKADGGHFCPVRQIALFFALKEPQVQTIH